MRKSLFRIEMHRGLFGRGMALSLAVGLLLAVSHVIMIVLPMIPTLEANLLYPDKWVTPHTVFVKWMGGGMPSLQGYLFYLIAPFSLPCPLPTPIIPTGKAGTSRTYVLVSLNAGIFCPNSRRPSFAAA